MPQRLRLIIIIVLGVLIVGGAVTIFLIPRLKGLSPTSQYQAPTTTPVTSRANTIDSTNFDATKLTPAPVAPAAPAPAAETPVAVEQQGVEGYARIFAQIYGTYSSDNNYQNVKEIQTVVTPNLWNKIKPPVGARPATAFTSVTTRVLKSDLAAWTATTATVNLEAQRTEVRNGKTTTFNQKATVTLVKQNTSWLVDSFVWQKL